MCLAMPMQISEITGTSARCKAGACATPAARQPRAAPAAAHRPAAPGSDTARHNPSGYSPPSTGAPAARYAAAPAAGSARRAGVSACRAAACSLSACLSLRAPPQRRPAGRAAPFAPHSCRSIAMPFPAFPGPGAARPEPVFPSSIEPPDAGFCLFLNDFPIFIFRGNYGMPGILVKLHSFCVCGLGLSPNPAGDD